MAKTSKQNIFSEDEIISVYMELVNSFDGSPELDQFCDHAKIDEDNFFDYFNSVQHLEKVIWRKLMEQAILTIQNDPQFLTYSNQDKLLSLFYTFFENLTLNREYLLINLSNYSNLKSRKKLYEFMKPSYLEAVVDIFKGNSLGVSQKFIAVTDSIKNKSIGESLWLQLTLLISFWKRDTSVELVKTDAAIEKSVQVVIDIMDTSRIKNFIDFGKFLWNEKNNFTRKN